MFFFLCDGDVEGGVVFGVGSGIILRSMVWGLSNSWTRTTGIGIGGAERLDHGCHGRGPASASPEAVT